MPGIFGKSKDQKYAGKVLNLLSLPKDTIAKPVKSGYITPDAGIISLTTERIYHNALHHDPKQEGGLYTQTALNSHQYFRGTITGSSDDLKLLAGLLQQRDLRFGRSKTAQYAKGLCKGCMKTGGSRQRTLRILTPAVYKLHSKPCAFPDLPRLFHSVIAKLRVYENITVSDEDFRLACQEMFVSDWGFERVEYNITGRMQQNMISFMQVQLPQDAAQEALLNTVFSYATFSGVGARTSLGMGGFLYL